MSKDHRQVLPLRNEGLRPLTVVLEPWGSRHLVMPGEEVFVIAQSPCEGELEVVREADEIMVYGWSESRVELVRDKPFVEAAAAPETASPLRGTALAQFFLDALDTPADPARAAANEEPERRNAESLEAYYVKTGQRAGEAAFARVLAEPGSTAARRELLNAWKASANPRAEILEKQLARHDLNRGAVDLAAHAFDGRGPENKASAARAAAWASSISSTTVKGSPAAVRRAKFQTLVVAVWRRSICQRAMAIWRTRFMDSWLMGAYIWMS